MTLESTTTSRVIVVGTLDAIRDRGRQAISRRTRNELRGAMEQVALQVRSPYGGTFQLPLEFEPGVKGRGLLDGAQAGATLVLVEGDLQLKKRFDDRYAHDLADQGREVYETRLHVRELRAPTDAEREAASAVWLEGVVAQPVRLVRHPELPNLQFAMTILEVTLRRPSAFPGSRSVVAERARVSVAIPTNHEHAGLLYRPGNVVRVEGAVDCMLERQGGEEVETMRQELLAAFARELEALPERWQQERTASQTRQERQGQERRPPAPTLEAAQRQLERRQRRELQRLGQAPHVHVTIGYAELLEGAPATLDESQELRRAFVQQARARRASNAAQRALASGVGRAPRGRRDDGAEAALAIISQAPDATILGSDAAEVAGTVRPRRRERRAEVEQAAVVGPAATLLDAPQAPEPEVLAPVTETDVSGLVAALPGDAEEEL